MEQRTVTIKNFSRITKIVQVSAMKVHFQIAERSLFYLDPDIHYRRMVYPPERGVGYSSKYVQALTQNFVHHYLVHTPDFTDYRTMYQGLYMYSGYYNRFSLFDY